jgi:hypothetical protein
MGEAGVRPIDILGFRASITREIQRRPHHWLKRLPRILFLAEPFLTLDSLFWAAFPRFACHG